MLGSRISRALRLAVKSSAILFLISSRSDCLSMFVALGSVIDPKLINEKMRRTHKLDEQ